MMLLAKYRQTGILITLGTHTFHAALMRSAPHHGKEKLAKNNTQLVRTKCEKLGSIKVHWIPQNKNTKI